ncbi:MAG: putative membrane protein, partial [Pelotomaculum thermopropionicum]
MVEENGVDILSPEFSAVQEYVEQLDTEIKSSVPRINFKDMVTRLVNGEMDWQPAEIFKKILRQIFSEVVANLDLLGKLVILAVICAVLQNLISSFEKNTVGKLTHSIIYLVLITIAVSSFTLAVNAGREVVDTMVIFMQALLPVLL